MVERLRFAVDHIRLAIRDRFAIAYTAPDLTHHRSELGYGRGRLGGFFVGSCQSSTICVYDIARRTTDSMD